MAEKRITFASKELVDFKKQLEQSSVRNILAASNIRMENARNYVHKVFWPHKGDWVVWAYKSDEEDMYKGIELFCQYIYDHKIRNGQCPPRPRNGNVGAVCFRYFNLLSQRFNAGDFTLTFKEIN